MIHSPNKRGFTLIEAVVVIASLVILAMALVPQDNLSNVNVEAATQRLEEDLRYAKELALIKNINCGIQITANGNYLLYEGTPATPTLNPLTQQNFINYNLGQNFKKANIVNLVGTLQIEFNPTGQPVMGSGSIIQVGDGLKTISLQITPNTGLVQRL